LSDIELQKYDEVINLLENFSSLKGYAILKKALLRAYIKSANFEVAQKLMSTIMLTNAEEWMDIYLFASKEFLIAGNNELATQYLDEIIDGIKTRGKTNNIEKQIVLAESLFLRKNYLEAELILKELLREDPSLITQISLLAIVYQKNGKIAEAEAQIRGLEERNSKYQYGYVSYALAQYYASISNYKSTINYLTKAVVEGHWYETSSFQNDPFFKEYIHTDEFKSVLSFWH
jgi:tetratricopeptide (TPR) repeat protein